MYKLILFWSILGALSCTAPQPAEPRRTTTPDAETVVLSEGQLRNAGIVTGKPELRRMQQSIQVSGVVDVPPENRISVSFPLGGYLRTLHLLPGMPVRRGEVLAVLEDPSFVQLQEDYLMAEVRLELQQKEYERQKLLNQSKTSSDKAYEQAAADYGGTGVMVHSLAEKLRLIGLDPGKVRQNTITRSVPILSPINGYVTDVQVNAGRYVTPADVLFELVNLDDLHVALTVFEKDAAQVRAGQEVRIRPVNDTTQVYTGRVMLTGRSIDSNRSIMVHCHFLGKPPMLLPGIFVQAQVMVQEQKLLTVPVDAVVRSGDREFVFVQEDAHRFRLTPVITGAQQNGFVGIGAADHPLAGKDVITAHAYSALMKLKNVGEEE